MFKCRCCIIVRLFVLLNCHNDFPMTYIMLSIIALEMLTTEEEKSNKIDL